MEQEPGSTPRGGGLPDWLFRRDRRPGDASAADASAPGQSASADRTEPELAGAAGDDLERTSLGLGRAGIFRERVQRTLWLRIVFALALVALILGAIYPAYLYYRRPRPVYTSAKTGNITLTTSAQGTIQAMIYSATFGISGVIAQVEVVPGQKVRAGDTLATLDSTPEQAALSAAQTTASDAQSDVDGAATTVTDAQTALASAQTALASAESSETTACSQTPPNDTGCAAAETAEAQSQAQVDAAQAQIGIALNQQARAQAALDSAQSALTVAQRQMAATTLIAPHAGIALTVNGQAGDEVAAGGAPLVTIADTAQPLATVLVGYKTINMIAPGQTATLRAPQVTGAATIKGTVYGFALIPQGSGNELAYPVTIAIDPNSIKSGVSLLPGMSASATIITRQVLGVVTLPVSVVAYAHQAAPANGKGLLTKEQIDAALVAAQQLEQDAIAGGLDPQYDPPTATYLIGFSQGKYIAIPAVVGLSDDKNQEIIAGVQEGDQIVSSQRNPLLPFLTY
jgi:multidrug resistance efflux pump